MKRYLEIAKITKPHGLKGEMRAVYYCDNPNDIADFKTMYLQNGERLELEYSRVHKNVALLKLKGTDTVEQAQKYINKMLYIDREDVELPEDVWFVQDVIGVKVIDADSGKVYGKVKDILQNSPTDVYVIAADDGRELLFPALPEVLLEMDIEKGEAVIRPLEGLFD